MLTNSNGKFYYAATAEEIRDAIWGIQEDTIGEIDKTDTDGDGLYDIYETAGMRIPNGQVIYSDPTKKDTDGDGLSDGQEMGMPAEVRTLTDNYELETIDMKFFNYTSNPNEVDSDFDNATDSEDATPLETNDFKNYIFYEKGGDLFLAVEATDRLVKYIKKDKLVNVYPVNTLNGFKEGWNSMGKNNRGKIEYQIDEVVTIFHGAARSIYIYDEKSKPNQANNSLRLSTYANDTKNMPISSLDEKHINRLILSSCNNGNLDYLNSFVLGTDNYNQNVAISFMKEMPGIKEVHAWDGSSRYVPIIGYETHSSSENFRNMSFDKNGFERLSTGEITYFRIDNGIDFTPRIKYGIRKIQLHDGTYGEDYFVYYPLEVIK